MHTSLTLGEIKEQSSLVVVEVVDIPYLVVEVVQECLIKTVEEPSDKTLQDLEEVVEVEQRFPWVVVQIHLTMTILATEVEA